uniref:Uncharacterized protein n=2 Tax=Magnoliopsida TaxID=3398 RepID=A0A2N9G3L9_FAGSY
MKIDGECLIELIGSCRNKVQVYRSVRMPQLHTSLHFHLTPIVMINGSSRRDLLLNSQNFCRSIPAGAENPSLSRLCYRRLWGSRNRRALILGWAYYLDAFSSYPLRTWLPSVYRGHDNCPTLGTYYSPRWRRADIEVPNLPVDSSSLLPLHSRANLRLARGNLCTPPLPFGRPTPHRNCLPETVPWPVVRIFTDMSISPSLSLRDSAQIVTPFVRVGTLPDKEFRYLRTVIVTAAVHRGFGRRLPCHQSPGPGHCDPLCEEAPLLPKLRGYFAEFLRESCLAPLGILYLPTCVGFGYRYPFVEGRSSFSWEYGMGYFSAVAPGTRTLARGIFSTPSYPEKAGAPCALTHPPWTNLAEEPLGFRGIGFSPMFALLKPTFSLPLRPPPLSRVLPSKAERSPTDAFLHPTASADRLAPFIFGARALDHGHLGALAGDPGCFPLDDEAYPPSSHWPTLTPVILRSYLVFRVCLDLVPLSRPAPKQCFTPRCPVNCCASTHFGENQLALGSSGISPLTTTHPLILQHQLAFATAPVGSLNQATAYESPAHSSTGTRSEPRAPPTAWELTVSCSISLPDGGSEQGEFEAAGFSDALLEGYFGPRERSYESRGVSRPVNWGHASPANSSLIERSCAEMNGAKRSAEAVGCKKASVGERSALEGSTRESGGGRSGSENVGLSNANIGENPMPRKPKGSSARFVHGGVRRGRENASSQCSSTRRYGAEVTHAILPGKARTTFNKRVPVPETDTERPYEASLFPGIGFGPFLRSLGGGRRRPPSGGARAASQKVTEACKGFLGPDGDWPSSAKAEGSLTARPTRRAGTKVGLSDPTVPSLQRIKVTLGITGWSSHRREGLAPRCRLFATWGCSMFQGLGCSPIKAVRELGSERRETVRSISGVGVRALRGPFPSTRGPGRTHLWCTSYRAHEPPVAQPRQRWVLCPCGDGATEVLRIQEKVTARRAVYHYDRCQVEVQ